MENNMTDTKKRAKDFLNRYFDSDDTYGARDFVEDIRDLVEEDSESEFGQGLSRALRTYDTKLSYGVGDLAYAVDVAVNGWED